MSPTRSRRRFPAFPDALAAVESDQHALARQFDLCRLAAGPWSALEDMVQRVHAFVVPRVMSLLVAGGLLGTLGILIG